MSCMCLIHGRILVILLKPLTIIKVAFHRQTDVRNWRRDNVSKVTIKRRKTDVEIRRRKDVNFIRLWRRRFLASNRRQKPTSERCFKTNHKATVIRRQNSTSKRRQHFNVKATSVFNVELTSEMDVRMTFQNEPYSDGQPTSEFDVGTTSNWRRCAYWDAALRRSPGEHVYCLIIFKKSNYFALRKITLSSNFWINFYVSYTNQWKFCRFLCIL